MVKRAWFRCYWAFGKPICVWWDDETHRYNVFHLQKLKSLDLRKLYQITRVIQRLTELDFFSTEIVFTTKNKFVVVDYVNDQCDMRLKSLHQDGVPDEIVNEIINQSQISSGKKKSNLSMRHKIITIYFLIFLLLLLFFLIFSCITFTEVKSGNNRQIFLLILRLK